MNENLTEAEREQLKTLAILQKIAWLIIRKWSWLLASVFVLSLGAFAFFLIWRAAYSVSRFDASTRLLYSPRSIAKLDGPNDKQVMSILDRATLKRRVGERMAMPERERMCLKQDLEIRQERKPTNLFTLTAASGSWKGAVKKVNLYAEVLTQAYVDYRSRDLDNLTDSLQTRQKGLMEKLAQIDAEVRTFAIQTGEPAPVEALQVLNAVVSDQRRELSTLNVQISNEELKKRKVERETGGCGAAIVSCAPQIRQRAETISQLDAELAKLREVYTDLNPKVAGKLVEREALQKELEHFLSEKGIVDVDVEDFDRIEKAATELTETTARLAVLGERRNSVREEIAVNEKKIESLNAIVPRFERLRARRGELESSVRDLEDKISDIAYLKSSLASDIQQIERAGGAGDKGIIRVKRMLLALAAAGFVTGVVLLWLLAYEFLWGRVRGGAEVAVYDDTLQFIGSVPHARRSNSEEMKGAIGVVALRFCAAGSARGNVLVFDLPGAEANPVFGSQVIWSASMSGLRVFSLKVVLGLNFEPPKGAVSMLGLYRQDGYGWFPVANRFTLAPTEQQMLTVDLAELHKEFDLVLIHVEGGARRGGSFFSQLLDLADAVLVVVGENKTTRDWFASARQMLKKSGKPGLALVTGASVKTVRKELEISK